MRWGFTVRPRGTYNSGCRGSNRVPHHKTEAEAVAPVEPRYRSTQEHSMGSAYSTSAKKVIQLASETRARWQGAIAECLTKSQRLLQESAAMERSWSGSDLGYHHELYYGAFATPPLDRRFSIEWGGVRGIPDGWRPRSPEEVRARIEQLADAQFDDVEGHVDELTREGESLRKDIVVLLSPIRVSSRLKREAGLLDEIDNLNWNVEITYDGRQIVTRDSEAVSEGRKLPAHTYYRGLAHRAHQRLRRLEELLSKSEDLSRRILALEGHGEAAATSNHSRDTTPLTLEEVRSRPLSAGLLWGVLSAVVALVIASAGAGWKFGTLYESQLQRGQYDGKQEVDGAKAETEVSMRIKDLEAIFEGPTQPRMHMVQLIYTGSDKIRIEEFKGRQLLPILLGLKEGKSGNKTWNLDLAIEAATKLGRLFGPEESRSEAEKLKEVHDVILPALQRWRG